MASISQKGDLYAPYGHTLIRIKGKFSQPTYADAKCTRLRPQEGSYYVLYAGRRTSVGSDPLLALDALAAKEKWVRDAERGVVAYTAPVKAKDERLAFDDASKIYLTTGKAAEKDWRKHTLQCYTLALKLFRESCQNLSTRD